jgi:hypothetical protein
MHSMAHSEYTLSVRTVDGDNACLSEDVQHRMQLQNKLAGFCEDMCKEVGSFPKCQCPGFVAPDSTPGVMTWPELLEHMDNLGEWGNGQLKERTPRVCEGLRPAAYPPMRLDMCFGHAYGHADQFLIYAHVTLSLSVYVSYVSYVSKEVGSFPKCQCPSFAAPDSMPDVLTSSKLLEHMCNLAGRRNDRFDGANAVIF